MLGKPTHDERARLDIVGAMKLYVGRQLRPGNRAFFETEARPAFEAAHGHSPATTDEISDAMHTNAHWQLWSAMNRATQEQMWDAVQDTLLREEPRMRDVYAKVTGGPNTKGSLDLDPDCRVPAGVQDNEIHLQPGGYVLERDDEDFLAGAFYELGGAVYSRAQGIGTGQSKGEIIIGMLQAQYPGFRPTRILDMACSAGSSSTPYAEAFPDAEVHAVDVAPGLLRYAHARAEALGLPVHFHQRHAADTKFEDESFDLVVSHNVMHEMSAEDVAGMMRESYRLLKPGGVCVHQDVPLRYDQLDPYMQFDYGWDHDYNCEPFWVVYGTNNPRGMLLDAGFGEDDLYVGFVKQGDGSFQWYVATARKAT
jgi:SAM-dependent methyltransferase